MMKVIPFWFLLVACGAHVSHDMRQWDVPRSAKPTSKQDDKKDIMKNSWLAKTGSACKDRTDGGCMIDYFTQLDFEKDSVTVTGLMEAHCSPTNIENMYNDQRHVKRYAWYLTADNHIQIPGSYVGPLKLMNNTLVTDSSSANVHSTFSPRK